MQTSYCIWVDLQHKLISLVETAGFTRFLYDSQAALEKVLRLLRADGYRLVLG